MNQSLSIERQLREQYKIMASRSDSLRIAQVLIWCVLCLGSLLGNLATIIIILRNRRLRTSTNMFVASLAVSDFGITALNALPFGTPSLWLGSWPFADIACQYMGYSVLCATAASVQTLAWTAVNRFYRVVKPSKYNSVFSKRRTAKYIVSVWMLASVSSVPYFAGGDKFIFQPAKFLCFFTLKRPLPNVVSLVGAICVPGAIVCYCYSRVFIAVRKHKASITRSRTSISAEDIKITKTLVAIVCAYVCCWFPVLVIDVTDLLSGKWGKAALVYYVYGILAISSSAASPAIYAIFNPVFRRGYLRLFNGFYSSNSVLDISINRKPRYRALKPFVGNARHTHFNRELELAYPTDSEVVIIGASHADPTVVM
ncbi:predicted protein [Nematostella vectensis]|uniref:G-protein coupled receptors family 1 profile domain-containing protein n=1 Tax=Nematostella vectensis TaxID=45351 RepID=A7SB34_NEMVE|nr:predicted protein [Nematostella vectensis]|eukprot:XP_001631172.1 predicted protein [Nematostella vectensis]